MREKATAFALALTLAGCVGDTTTVHVSPTHPQALLWTQPFLDLIVEIDYVEGYRPSELAVTALLDTLVDLTRKRSIEVRGPDPIPQVRGDAATTRTFDDLRELHEGTADVTTGYGIGETAVLHVVFPDGTAEPPVAGLALGNVIFVLKDAVGGFHGVLDHRTDVTVEDMERHVIIHELGHTFGLVDCGIPMLTPRLDDSGMGCHSTNEESVMHARMDTIRAGLDLLDEGRFVPYTFDDADLKDIRAFQAQQPATRPPASLR